jgi:hypothetical protein
MKQIKVKTMNAEVDIDVNKAFITDDHRIFFISKISFEYLLFEYIINDYIRVGRPLTDEELNTLLECEEEKYLTIIEYIDESSVRFKPLSEERIDKILNKQSYKICFHVNDKFFELAEINKDEFDKLLQKTPGIESAFDFGMFNMPVFQIFFIECNFEENLEIDNLLDRINIVGYDNLTKMEKEELILLSDHET